MEEDNTNQNSTASGGDPADHGGGGSQNPSGEERTVSYKSYQKLLGEKKRLQDRLTELQNTRSKPASGDDDDDTADDEGVQNPPPNRRDDANSRRLKVKDNRIKDLETQLAESNNQISQFKRRQEVSDKVDALLEAIPGEVPRKYLQLLPINDLVVDPETGEIDPVSLKQTVKKFMGEYGEVIKTKPNGMPNTSPNGGSNKGITLEAWQKMPFEEQKKHKYEDLILPKK